jgi:hypothetical protein
VTNGIDAALAAIEKLARLDVVDNQLPARLSGDLPGMQGTL